METKETKQQAKQAIARALALVGGLSKTSKMPCQSYSIPARACKTGAKLVGVRGSVCEKCYALGGFYRMPNVASVLGKRLASLDDLPAWQAAMTLAIDATETSGFFRWHDSGDLQSVAHLEAIVEIARALPAIRFWLPTKELGFVRQWLDGGGVVPSNLTIRQSAFMVGAGKPVLAAYVEQMPSSGVVREGGSCPAPKQGNKCGDCRACWDKTVSHVTYTLH